MIKFKSISLLMGLILFSSFSIAAQNITISGTIQNSETGEPLLGVNIFEQKSKAGTVSNNFGFYSLSVANLDSLTLNYSYIGYDNNTISGIFKKDSILNIKLKEGNNLVTAMVTASKENDLINKPIISKTEISIAKIKKLPAFMGEIDVLRAFQLMPGIQSGAEGTSGLHVRGGSPDQNLILLDDVPLYYVNHIGGFVSVFDANAISKVTVYKGGYPARFGGRLSSIVDVRMKEGNKQNLSGEIGLGLISSKIFLETPLKKDKTSLIISARRSLADLIIKGFLAVNGTPDKSGYSLYDINAKVAHKLSEKDRLYFSVYTGGDNIKLVIEGNDNQNDDFKFEDKAKIRWGNLLTVARWNHIYNAKLFSNLTFGRTQFSYKIKSDAKKIETASDQVDQFSSSRFTSSIEDWLAKIDFEYYPNANHTIKYGGAVTWHKYNPSVSNFKDNNGGTIQVDTSIEANVKRPLDANIYLEDEFNISEKISFNLGMHFAANFTDNQLFLAPQPRFISNFKISNDLSFKVSYTRMTQFLHLLSNTSAGLPVDLWVPATKKAKPENSHQIVVGAVKNLNKNWQLTVEGFYKTMDNLIEFEEGTSFFIGSSEWEEKVETSGKGKVYGLEILIEKKLGKTTGWVGYTLSKNRRQFENINNGNPFPYIYDRTHDFTFVINHEPKKNVNLSASWVYTTGNALTLATEKNNVYNYGGQFGLSLYEGHIYNGRNSYRAPSYHRLDINASFTKKVKRGIRTINIGLYNAYSRNNPYYLYFDEDNSGERFLYQLSLFPVLPTFSYNLKF